MRTDQCCSSNLKLGVSYRDLSCFHGVIHAEHCRRRFVAEGDIIGDSAHEHRDGVFRVNFEFVLFFALRVLKAVSDAVDFVVHYIKLTTASHFFVEIQEMIKHSRLFGTAQQITEYLFRRARKSDDRKQIAPGKVEFQGHLKLPPGDLTFV